MVIPGRYEDNEPTRLRRRDEPGSRNPGNLLRTEERVPDLYPQSQKAGRTYQHTNRDDHEHVGVLDRAKLEHL
jgi:hypothetical protein